MRVKITKEMRFAIQQAIEEAGSQSELARRSGVDQRNLSRYVSGLNTMTDHIWAALYPYCASHLPADYPAPLRERPILQTDFGADAEAMPVTREEAKRFRQVPVLSIAQAAGYEPALEPLCDYLREVTDETALFFDVPDTCFALRITGDSMSPDYPDGSIALVAAGEYPERGDIVAAKLATGQVVIKRYQRKDNVITLESINPAGKSFKWHCKEQPGYAQWIWPVLKIEIDTRAQRHAENGLK